MKIYFSRLAASALLAGSAVCFAAQPGTVVLSNVRDHFASGPVSLPGGQSASACATNPDDSPVSVLIALLQADTGSLLNSRQVVLQPGTGVCVNYSRPQQQGQAIVAVSANVYAVVVPDGRLEANGRIVQDRPGSGGCIVASLQIQVFTVNNTPSQTILYAPMLKHHHPAGQNGN